MKQNVHWMTQTKEPLMKTQVGVFQCTDENVLDRQYEWRHWSHYIPL